MNPETFANRDACAGRAIRMPQHGEEVFSIRNGVIRHGRVNFDKPEFIKRADFEFAVGFGETGYHVAHSYFTDGGPWWVMEIFFSREAAQRVLNHETRKRANGLAQGIPINGISRP